MKNILNVSFSIDLNFIYCLIRLFTACRVKLHEEKTSIHAVSLWRSRLTPSLQPNPFYLHTGHFWKQTNRTLGSNKSPLFLHPGLQMFDFSASLTPPVYRAFVLCMQKSSILFGALFWNTNWAVSPFKGITILSLLRFRFLRNVRHV